MLKFILPILLLMNYVKKWNMIQFSLFFLSFIFSVFFFHSFFLFGLWYLFGMDYISYVLILLSLWIVSLIMLASQKVKNVNNFYSSFVFMNLLLLLFLIIAFSSLDYFLFYIGFEMSLIPIMILILGWGYQPERIQAGIYMLFYTLLFSLPLLLSMLIMFFENGSLMMGLKMVNMGMSAVNIVLYFAMIMAFLVKLPMYMLHLWLPKAHVEAPLAGSMILAGVLLKLGGYGLIRILNLLSLISMKCTWIWISFGLIGGIMVSFLCLRQVDMKSLIAYSSVAHMGLVLCGLIIFSWWSVTGAIVVMVGHGLCSSGLFCLANIVYERLNSRSLLVAKGLLSFMPSMGLWWFLLSISNMASPPTLNLLGEISLIIGTLSWSKFSFVGIMFLSFFSASYTLYMYSMSQHGLFFNSVYGCCSGKVQEYMVLFLHWFPLNMLILNSSMVWNN